jgi:type II secretory pathway pseudopilin PulG
MFPARDKDGYALLEVVIAVALVAIMAVSLGPPIAKNLGEGKRAQAQDRALLIGNAVLDFYKDVGEFPLQGDTGAGPELMRLVGNAALGGGNAGIPGGEDRVVGAHRWSNLNPAGTLTDHLVHNAAAAIGTLYTLSQRPDLYPGWNGPYLEKVPLDPWGNPYVVNVRYAHPRTSGPWAVANDRHTVMVLSAGPNKTFETPFDDGAYHESFGGDDIGYIVRSPQRR